MDVELINTITLLLYAIAALASIFSAILAWVAKIRWSDEFSAAKNAEVESMKTALSSVEKSSKAQLDIKDEHIKLLEKENSFLNIMTPEVLRKRFADANQGLIATISEMGEEVEELKTELKGKSDQIDSLRKVGEESSEKENLLKAQIKELEDKVNSTETELERLESARLSKPEWEKLDTFINASGTYVAQSYISEAFVTYNRMLLEKLKMENILDTIDKNRVMDEPIFKSAKGGDSVEKNNNSDDSNAK